jgi:hypothetical protein
MSDVRTIPDLVDEIRALAHELSVRSRGCRDTGLRHALEEAGVTLAECALKLAQAGRT